MMNIRLIIGVIIIVCVAGGIGYYYITLEDTPEPSCGNGICEPEYGETYETCPGDCEEPPDPHCGNGIKEPELGENCATCPEDYGPCPPEPEGIGFRLPYSSVSNGDTFWVTVYCDMSSEAIGGWKLSIGYDDSILEAQDVTVDGMIWLYDEGTIGSGEIIDIQAWTTQDDLTSKIDLCKIKFKALNSGISSLTFTAVKMSNSDAIYIYPTENDNSITIQ